ncbi:MAG TPA: PEGA domain-containing protein [Polyangiales bacterium]|nr:PEGA domain-containing protein [Polyangiales bacterium]
MRASLHYPSAFDALEYDADSAQRGEASPSAALRERLSQTRARIARAHVANAPQIDVDWDPDEPPTRVYQGQALLSPRALARGAARREDPNPLTSYAFEQFRARVTQRPAARPHARVAHTHAAPEHAARPHARVAHTHVAPEHAAPEHAAPVRATPEHAAPVHAARPHARVEHTQAEPMRATPAHAAPMGAAPAHTTPMRAAPAHTTPAHTTPARATPREVSVTQRATAQLPKAAPISVPMAVPTQYIPVPEEQQHTLPPLASRVLREATLMGERIGKLYEGLDRSDTALRRRVAYCSLALLVIAASSRMLFGGHSSAASEPPAPAKQTAIPLSANVAISSDPPGAQIILNGRASSHVTPTKLTDLAPGRYMIGLKLAGYAEAKEALRVPGDALVSIKLAALDEPRFAPEKTEERATLTRAEQRAQARELARERRAAARAAKVLLRYRARMGLPPDPVAQELVEAYGPTQSAE